MEQPDPQVCRAADLSGWIHPQYVVDGNWQAKQSEETETDVSGNTNNVLNGASAERCVIRFGAHPLMHSVPARPAGAAAAAAPAAASTPVSKPEETSGEWTFLDQKSPCRSPREVQILRVPD